MFTRKDVKMVDITFKKEVYREAVASGKIILRKETLKKIVKGEIEKGNVFNVATVAAILAAKRTWELIPLCHPIPITNVKVDFAMDENSIVVKVVVKTTAKTGVEMEALTGVTTALLTIWDMVKKYEKDEKGQYPFTRIVDVKVESKIKRE
ncbi:MAG: cyclic pyranopterin monophosphate synthase MoaC [Thermoprotei archaeon]|nr:cyclic pyranopterin monophosphate synthase MoaC [Thermoprotei archaeon]